MRFTIPILVALTVVACSGGEDEPAAPVPLAQRFLTAEDAPGTSPDPVETRHTTADYEDFIAALHERVIDPDEQEMTTAFPESGFKRAGADARFFGETHKSDAPHVFSSFIELGSEGEARRALDWLEADSMKPCPMSCATRVNTFDVDGKAAIRGVHRIATAEDIERAGTEDEHPSESYWVGFTVGSIVYAMDLHGPPGSVTEEQALDIANALLRPANGQLGPRIETEWIVELYGWPEAPAARSSNPSCTVRLLRRDGGAREAGADRSRLRDLLDESEDLR